MSAAAHDTEPLPRYAACAAIKSGPHWGQTGGGPPSVMKVLAKIARIAFWTALALLVARRAGTQQIPNLPALTPAELQITDNAKQPGSLAMILCFAVETDNIKSTETHSMRIKIFRDEGKKYANVEIPYVEKYSEVQEIVARTIGSDGKVTPFADKIFDREIVNV